MTRFERIKNMSMEEMAAKIIKANITDEYCKSDCDDEDCKHELECCIKWLNEKV